MPIVYDKRYPSDRTLKKEQAMRTRRPLVALALLLALCGSAAGEGSDDRRLFNVRDYGAKGDAVTDDSVAIASAAGAAAAVAANHRSAALYFPSGFYRLVASLPTWTAPLSVLGDGHAQSVIVVDPAFSGDVFSWSDVSGEARDDDHGAWRELTDESLLEIKGIRIVGNRTTTNRQNAFVFYDRADHVLMQDVDVFYMTGRVLYSGVTRRTPQSYVRGSRFDSLRFFNCGSPGAAVVDFNSAGSVTATSDVIINDLDVYAPYGTGVIIHSGGAPVHAMRFSKLRIEGLVQATIEASIKADLLQVGDASLGGNVNDIAFDQTELIDPYSGFAGIHFAGTNLSTAPYDVRFEGAINGGSPAGKGIVIDAGRNLNFDLKGIYTLDTNVVVASALTVAGPIILDGHGLESTWTRSIDSSSVANVKKPALQPF
jgi:hypothetical protein